MKLSTAIRKASKKIYLSPVRNEWKIVRHHEEGYVTESQPFPYAQARAYRKEAVAEEALIMLGVDSEDAMMVAFVHQEGTAEELAQRVIDKCEAGV